MKKTEDIRDIQNHLTVTDVPSQIFENFLEELKEAKISDEIIKGLRMTMIQERNITEATIRSAMFPNPSIS